MTNPVHVICIKWGKSYTAYDVNMLHASICHYTTNHTIAFHCFTENPQGLNPSITTHPLPTINTEKRYIQHNYLKEVGLCDDTLAGLQGQRVFFFDLDILITDTMDEMFDYPQTAHLQDAFIIINDWNSRNNTTGQATCYTWTVGTLGHVKKTFESNPQKYIQRYGTASQEFLSHQVIKHQGHLNFWPQQWITSFKFHCLPPWYKRPFVPATLPKNTKIIAFHGHPKLQDAIKGTWGKKIPWYERYHKTITPNPWLKNYIK